MRDHAVLLLMACASDFDDEMRRSQRVTRRRRSRDPHRYRLEQASLYEAVEDLSGLEDYVHERVSGDLRLLLRVVS